MKKSKRRISTDLQLLNCISSKINVEVWISGILSGVVTLAGFDEDTLHVDDGSYYLRDNCVLITSQNYLTLA